MQNSYAGYGYYGGYAAAPQFAGYGYYGEPADMAGYGGYAEAPDFAEYDEYEEYDEADPLGYYGEADVAGYAVPGYGYYAGPEMVGYGEYEPMAGYAEGPVEGYGDYAESPDLSGYVASRRPVYNPGCPLPTNVNGYGEYDDYAEGPVDGYAEADLAGYSRPRPVSPRVTAFTPPSRASGPTVDTFRPLW